MRTISRTVWILSLISLFTDMASEMLYPVMPIYLKSIGFGVLLIGVLEGVAEAAAGLSKGYFGMQSDVMGRRAPFVQFGYALSALSKPMMALFVAPLWIFFARTIDRLGKGIRTGARDAMLSDEATPSTKGRLFGLHRSMDTLGAVIGPVLALLYLWARPGDYVPLFFIAFGPGVLAIVLSFLLKDKSGTRSNTGRPVPFSATFSYWKRGTPTYRRLTAGLLLFALFNSSDVFLLLQAKNAGLSDTATIGVYIFYNLVYALAAYPLGVLADRIGLKRVLLSGLALFAVVYFGMANVNSLWAMATLFFLYGVYAAATEGIGKAWISNVVPRSETASAIGTYAGFNSICALVASSFAGLLWFAFGPEVTFVVTACSTVVVMVYLAFATSNTEQPAQ
ncbi:MAG: MFS transporter [Flavobacteriales bacterium]|nr:MFS transporter [Flavobacteriales bacterium]MCC6937798.1 MFS transporter [Flavobacteriales bacterium]